MSNRKYFEEEIFKNHNYDSLFVSFLTRSELLYIQCRTKGWKSAKLNTDAILEHFTLIRSKELDDIAPLLKCQLFNIYLILNYSSELPTPLDYYCKIHISLGNDFLEEFYSSIQRILEFPNAWSKISKGCQRCILNRFPYAIIYHIREKEIIIIALMQLNRNPNYWVNRMYVTVLGLTSFFTLLTR